MGDLLRNLWRLAAAPVDDYLAALVACLTPLRVGRVLVIVGASAATWFVYVPIHELLHAAGCWLTGGEVTRLEIDSIYGAALLHRFFPFVAVGSEYAGQLTGFDTHGNDLIYLATDFLPFTLTILIGIPLLRAAARGHTTPWRNCAMLGAAMPVAYAPFISVSGDYYEMGSIIVTHTVSVWAPSFQRARWRSDDLVKLVHERLLADPTASLGDAAGIAASFVLGVVLIFVTYEIGTLWARLVLGESQSRSLTESREIQ